MPSLTQNQLIGTYGVPDPPGALRTLGYEPAYHDCELALAGSPVSKNSEGTVVVSGEVVLDNAAELRCCLARPEAEDGELLAELYLRFGPELGERALGMYAVAIWDTKVRTLLLIRDGVGCRTMYYATNGRCFWFANRLAPLRRSPIVSGEISPTALRDYLTYSYLPGEETMWRDVRELRPGSVLEIPSGRQRTFWEPLEPPGLSESARSLDEHAVRLRQTIEDAVQARLPPKGPVAVFLSGGVDSSLVTAIAAQKAQGPIHTYSVHFGAEYRNELSFARLVAARYETAHHVVEFTPQEVKNHFLETMAALDDPIGDPLTVPNLLLGRAAAQESGVILNGEGGDPCFGGPKNQPMFLHHLYSTNDSAEHASAEHAYLRSYQKCYEDLGCLLKPDVRAALSGAGPQAAIIAPYLSDSGTISYLNRLMRLNVQLKGAGHILTKVNNLTTANGVLGQSPLFDRRVVDEAFAIPPQFKVSGADEKVVLKKAVEDLLPVEIIHRPKSGMMVPVQKWFKAELEEFGRAVLFPRKSSVLGFFGKSKFPDSAIADPGGQALIWQYLEPSVVEEWMALQDPPRRLGAKLWLLLSLELWLRAHG